MAYILWKNALRLSEITPLYCVCAWKYKENHFFQSKRIDDYVDRISNVKKKKLFIFDKSITDLVSSI